uniref:Uncharacterized protein n=1 Tax=Glossina brevipalpis TaxID=37001 RepID=A0A1A9W9X8_9MUSC
MALEVNTRRPTSKRRSSPFQQSAASQALNDSRQHLQTMHRQRSFIETNLRKVKVSIPFGHFTNCTYMSRGLSLNRSQSIRQSIPLDGDKKKKEEFHSKSKSFSNKPINEEKSHQKAPYDQVAQRCSSSTTPLIKTADKEMPNFNNNLKKFRSSEISSSATHLKVGSKEARKEFMKKFEKTLLEPGTLACSVPAQKHSKPGSNKVNLNIVLSQGLTENKENGYLTSDAEEDNIEINPSRAENDKLKEKPFKTNMCKTKDTSSHTSLETNRDLFPSRKLFCHSSRVSLANTNNVSSTTSASNILTTRAPLLRAMSAPVRCTHDSSKDAFQSNKRKSRRRRLKEAPDKFEENIFMTKVQKPNNNDKKMLTRAHSTAPEVITLVSLISPEDSDSEKEDNSSVIAAKRAPSLKKTGKSVSFQETDLSFQLSSKECSHMLRRSSVAPVAARMRANRPPTAPPISIFRQDSRNSASDSTVEVTVPPANNESSEEKTAKRLEVLTYPDYIQSYKGRECWKLFLKMSASGVNIAYDTILRGLLTPTEFRQQQKQREVEETNKIEETHANIEAKNFSIDDNLKKNNFNGKKSSVDKVV